MNTGIPVAWMPTDLTKLLPGMPPVISNNQKEIWKVANSAQYTVPLVQLVQGQFQ